MSNLIITMPFKRHIHNGENYLGWKEAKCSVCGQACFKRPVPPEVMDRKPKEMCTECALKVVTK